MSMLTIAALQTYLMIFAVSSAYLYCLSLSNDLEQSMPISPL